MTRSESTFHIARYPVTYIQFQTFIDDPEGFRNPRWWDGLAADDERKRAPGGQRFKYGNHPRECVSWWDAVAFCRWLTEKAKTCPALLPEAVRGQAKLQITLPTEWQWEKAARGVDGREYPYKGAFDAAKGNTGETGIQQTSAVGIFPNGASPYGVLDMSGNVWEWCLNEYSNPQNIGLGGREVRVLRGGAWDLDQDLARCAFRLRFGPYRDVYLGFRCLVWSPPSL